MHKNDLMFLSTAKTPSVIRWQQAMGSGFLPITPVKALSSMQKNLLEKLKAVYYECRNDNWNGEDEEAISLGTYLLAQRILLLLFANNIHVDYIAPAPDGSVGFNWFSRLYSIYLRLKDQDIIYTRIDKNNPASTFLVSCQHWNFNTQIHNLFDCLYD